MLSKLHWVVCCLSTYVEAVLVRLVIIGLGSCKVDELGLPVLLLRLKGGLWGASCSGIPGVSDMFARVQVVRNENYSWIMQ